MTTSSESSVHLSYASLWMRLKRNILMSERCDSASADMLQLLSHDGEEKECNCVELGNRIRTKCAVVPERERDQN